MDWKSKPSHFPKSLAKQMVKSEHKSRSRKREIKMPSAYRYLALGWLQAILAIVGMIVGYDYGIPLGDFASAVFAMIGVTIGLIVGTAIVVKVALQWDKNIQQLTSSKAKHHRETASKSGKE